MATYNQLIHEYRKQFSEKGLSPETVKAFLFELCNDHQINLYLDMIIRFLLGQKNNRLN